MQPGFYGARRFQHAQHELSLKGLQRDTGGIRADIDGGDDAAAGVAQRRRQERTPGSICWSVMYQPCLRPRRISVRSALLSTRVRGVSLDSRAVLR